MALKIQHIKILNEKNRKAEFSLVFSDGKNEVILPRVVAVSGSKGIFVATPGKNVKDKKDPKKWVEIPNFYLNKELKAQAEKLIISHLASIEPKKK